MSPTPRCKYRETLWELYWHCYTATSLYDDTLPGPVLDSHECSATECSNGPTTKVDTDNHAKVRTAPAVEISFVLKLQTLK